MSTTFIGRQEELLELKQLHQNKTANLVIIEGRRRIGKSRLVEEFAKGKTFYCFTGIAPENNTDAQTQRDEFARQFSEQFNFPKFLMQDWGDLFTMLYKQMEKERGIILLDEISWMGSLDPTFLGKLKTAWDTQFKKNTKLMIILCGSVSSWIEKNIISSTLFLGRPSLYMKLGELPLYQCNQFWGKKGNQISAYEKFKILSIIGGIPRYLELMNPHFTAENNIRNLCFSPNAPLLDEFERIFSDIFGKRSEIYKRIIYRLVIGSANLDEILESCHRTKTGDFSEYLQDLEKAGFVARDFTWHIKSGKISKLSRYRLQDNYVRFYLKYIEPNKAKIKKSFFKKLSITSFPGWESIVALQFENFVLNNTISIIKMLGLQLEEITFLNPFFQRKTKLQSGCQIDLLIQTKFNNLFVCEIKFSKSKLPRSIIDEVQQKIDRLKVPKNFSCRSVLVHVNGVDSLVLEEDYFAAIIDFGELLTYNPDH